MTAAGATRVAVSGRRRAVGVLPHRRSPSRRRRGAGRCALALAWLLPDGASAWRACSRANRSCGSGSDALGRVFAIVFALLAALGAVYGIRRLCAASTSPGSPRLRPAWGSSSAGDWITLYASWETLAVASFVLITDGGTPRASGAALRYLLVHATGGALLLAGIVVHLATGRGPGDGPLDGAWARDLRPARVRGERGGAPLHAWLPDAYPESSPAGSVFLSAFATKAAVYAMIRVFAGTEGAGLGRGGMALYGVCSRCSRTTYVDFSRITS